MGLINRSVDGSIAYSAAVQAPSLSKPVTLIFFMSGVRFKPESI